MNPKPSILVFALLAAASALLLGLGFWYLTDPEKPVAPPQAAAATALKKPAKKAAFSQAQPTPAPEVAVTQSQAELQAQLANLQKAKGAVPSELLLHFKNRAALDAFRQRAAQAGIRVLFSDDTTLTARIHYTDPATMAQELSQHGADYAGLGPNHHMGVPALPVKDQPVPDPNNAGGTAQSANGWLNMIGATGDRSRWGAGVKVAVIDSGIPAGAYGPTTKVTSVNLSGDTGPMNLHGQHMGHLIASPDAQYGGVAPATDVLSYRVTGPEGYSNAGLISEGILRAVRDGARVINISMGGDRPSPMLQQAVQYARQRGVIVVAAAGNEGQIGLSYPAAYPGVISVAAVDAQGRQAYFSNSGKGIVIAAPGVGVVQARKGNTLTLGSGTSQATAITSGAIAALLSRNYSPQNIQQILAQKAQPAAAGSNAPEQVGAGVLRLPK
jgi:thermitase